MQKGELKSALSSVYLRPIIFFPKVPVVKYKTILSDYGGVENVEIRKDTFVISTEFWGRKLNLFILRGDHLFLIDTGLAGMPEDLIFPYMADQDLAIDWHYC